MRSTLPYSASVFLHVCLLGTVVGWIAADQSPVSVQIGGRDGSDGLTPGAGGGGTESSVIRFNLGAAGLVDAPGTALSAKPAQIEEPTPQPVGMDTRFDRARNDDANSEPSAARTVQVEVPGIDPLNLALDGPALPQRTTPARIRRAALFADPPASDGIRSAPSVRRSGAAPMAMPNGIGSVTVGGEEVLDTLGTGPGRGSGKGTGTGPGTGNGGGSGNGGAGSLPSAGPGNPLPIYPPDALAAGAEGRVVLRASIRADGTVESLTVERTAGWKSLDDSALETVRKWRFIPARENGRPVTCVILVPVRFRMLGGLSPP